MKRSEALALIFAELKSWESCQIEMRTANKVMKVIEDNIGMKPPRGEWKPERKARKNGNKR